MNTKLEEITIENIRKHFKNINEVNDYGGLVHAAVHNRYFRASVLKFIEVLFENGVDVNLKGKDTGYSFIHLALYGYTDEKNVDYSYTTEFIVELINLAKEYNLDVGIVDNDSDSLIHTALASEVYTGSVMSLIEALGPEFDISCKDGNGNDIYQALLKYKKEAEKHNNKMWFYKLTKEEEEIKRLVEVSKYNIDEINEELSDLKIKFDELTESTEINYILENYSYINKLHKSLDLCITAREMITEKKEEDFSNIWKNYSEVLRNTISSYISEIAVSPDFHKIYNLTTIINSFGFNDMTVDLEVVKNDYQNRINVFKEKINSTKTLQEVKNLKEELTSFLEEEVKGELSKLLEERMTEFKRVISKVNKCLNVLVFLYTWLAKESRKNKDESLEFNYNLSEMTSEELEKLNLELENSIAENKDLVKQAVAEKMEELLDSIRELDSSDVFEDSELFKIIEDKMSLEKEDKKVKAKNDK